MPCKPSRKATLKTPDVPVSWRMGVLYAAQLLPPSVVARDIAAPGRPAEPVAIRARLVACVATHVPLAGGRGVGVALVAVGLILLRREWRGGAGGGAGAGGRPAGRAR